MNDVNKRKERKEYTRIKRTYTSVETGLLAAFRFVSKWVDRILFNQKYGKLVAICLATIVCLVVSIDEDTNLFTNSMKSAIELGEIPVSANISTSEYEVSGLPESVHVTITGDASDVQYASQQKDNYQVIADLTELGEGRHEVSLEPLNFSRNVDVTMSQNTATVTVRKKISKSFSFTYEYTNTNQMDKIYSLGKPEFSSGEVIVKASEETMTHISYVKALIDVAGVKADFEKEARLVAYDFDGNKMDVEILPKTVNAKVAVSSPRKEVGINVVLSGELANNKAIASYTIDQKTMTIYAPQDVLDAIDEIDVAVPVNKLKGDTMPITVTVPIMLPEGVRKGSVTKVNISIHLEEAKEKILEDIRIDVVNLADGLKLANPIEAFDVKLIGTAKNLEAITASNIKLELDATSVRDVGEYELEVKIRSKNKLIVYSLEKEKVTIIIEKED